MPRLTMPLFRFRKPQTQQKSQLNWQQQTVQVTRKAMKSIRLRLQQDGQLSVSCPYQISDKQVMEFLSQRLDWIVKQQRRLDSLKAVHSGCNHQQAMRLWGKQYQFEVNSSAYKKGKISHQDACIYWPELPTDDAAASVFHQKIWRQELQDFIEGALPQWQKTMGVRADFWNVRNMKTKWGSCNVNRHRIWLNTQLAQYPKACAEMVLVHELAHLLEPSHNARFYHLMDSYLPDWRAADEQLKGTSLHF